MLTTFKIDNFQNVQHHILYVNKDTKLYEHKCVDDGYCLPFGHTGPTGPHGCIDEPSYMNVYLNNSFSPIIVPMNELDEPTYFILFSDDWITTSKNVDYNNDDHSWIIKNAGMYTISFSLWIGQTTENTTIQGPFGFLRNGVIDKALSVVGYNNNLSYLTQNLNALSFFDEGDILQLFVVKSSYITYQIQNLNCNFILIDRTDGTHVP